jgi:outer membrane protein TolC
MSASSTDRGLLTPQNCAVVLLDHQPQMLAAVSGQERKDLLESVLVLTRAAKIFRARAQFLGSEEARRGVRLTLLSDVATTYFQLLELDRELEIASRTTNSFGESLRIFSQRVEGGTASALQSARAEAAVDNAAAAVPAIRERISATENQLCILLGRNPGTIERPASLLTQLMPDCGVFLPVWTPES